MDWWRRLLPRERLAVAFAALCLLVLLAYVSLWQPLQSDLDRQNALRTRLDQDYAWMHQASEQIKAYRVGATVHADSAPRRSLLVEVDDSLKRAGMASALEEIKPDGGKLLRVTLKQVSFDQLWIWLGYLEQREIRVTSSAITRLAATATADVRLTFERPEE